MLKLNDCLGKILAEGPVKSGQQRQLKFYASEIMKELGYRDDNDVRKAMAKAFRICRSLHIPITGNFREVQGNEKDEKCHEWKLSPFACYLLIMNGNPDNPNVAKAQLELISGAEYVH